MTRSSEWSGLRVGCAWLLGLFYVVCSGFGQTVPPRKYAVQVSVQVQENPPEILLTWPNEGDAASYRISRRTLDSSWQQLAELGSSETSFHDANVKIGTKYEYQIVKPTYAAYTGYGYLSAGIKIAPVDNRGTVLVLVENSLTGALESELNRLKTDLIGDGWGFQQRAVSMYDSPQSVKELIQSVYYSNPGNLKALFLVGHVPVPYAGDFFPDGHANHRGAWPADSYYADIDGTWTDVSVQSTTAEREANWNVPGDGKLDQSNIPSATELMVGRVDLSNMTCYANKANARSELDLMRQYFNKDHAFRSGEISVQQRGLICDNFADKGADPISGSAWRNFSGFFGANNVTEVGWDGYLPAATQNSFLWSYASGGGSYYYSSGVATSDDFAQQDVHVIFTMFMGSYFGDWNNESNFLRAALGSGTVLTASYSGFPHTLYFPMALGEPIGYAIQLTQNNCTNAFYPPWNTGSGQVHIGLLGDPTLRMHPFRPANALSAADDGGIVRLSWNGSPEASTGYHVYRSSTAEGPYVRLTTEPVTQLAFSDTPQAGTYSYMVRAVRLETTPSGTYFNLSRGIFASASASGGGSVVQPPASPTLQATASTFNRVNLQWADLSDESSYEVQRSEAGGSWTSLATLSANTISFADTTVLGGTVYLYRLRASNSAGPSPFSAEVRVETPSAPAVSSAVHFAATDIATIGNWPDRYGGEGYAIAGVPSSAPSFAPPNTPKWIWATATTDPRAPLVSTNKNERAAAAWYGEKIICSLNLAESKRIALYLVDWDRSGRAETVTFSDTITGSILDSREISDFENGAYLTYDARGGITVTIARTSGPNAVLSGFFQGPLEVSPISDKPLALELHVDGTALSLQVSGDPGQKFKIYSSTDMQNWVELSSSTLSTGSIELPLTLDRSTKRMFFRTMNYR